MTVPHTGINVLLHQSLLTKPADSQSSSPLMTRLPAEIRNEIFKLALAEYVVSDPAARYKPNTPFVRPAYFAPRRTNTALLRTCRAVYYECWLMPHILKEETHWLAWEDRAPPDYSLEHELDLLRRRLEDIARHLGDGAKEAMEMDSLRVFAQLCNLDNGDMMTELVGTPHLRFRRLIITIRHTDWWNWEHDEPLGFPTGRWIEAMQSSLPETVTEVCMELESLERKKHQVNAIAEQMRKKWYFQRRDGVSLFADTTLIPVDFSETNKGATETPDGRKVKGEELVHYWSGYSIFNGRRWRRDEKVPGRLDYYVLKVPFRLLRVVEAKGGKVSPEVLHAAETYDISGLYEEISLPNETPLDWSDDDVLLVDESEDEHDEDSIHVEGEEQET